MPTSPPPRASSTLSISIWRARRPRVAPKARRTAISLRRPVAWAINRFAALAQAMARTSSTTAVSAPTNIKTTDLKRSGREPAGARRKPRSFSVSGLGLGKALGQHLEFSRGLGGRDAGPESRHHRYPVVRARLEISGLRLQIVRLAERKPKFRLEGRVEAAEGMRRHAHHGERPAGKRDGFAGQGRIGGETALPKAVAEDNDRQALLVTRETAAQRHAELRHIEEIRGDRLAPYTFRFAPAAHRSRQEVHVAGHAGERLGLLAHVGEERPGEMIAALVAVGSVYGQERRGVAHRRGTQNKPADHGEDGRVGGNAQADRDDHGENKTG